MLSAKPLLNENSAVLKAFTKIYAMPRAAARLRDFRQRAHRRKGRGIRTVLERVSTGAGGWNRGAGA